MKYGDRIAEERNRLELTQEEFAKHAGIQRSALSHYEKNRREPDLETLKKIAKALGVTTDYILGASKYRRGRLVTEDEMKTFLSPKTIDAVKSKKIKMLVDDVNLDESTKKDIEAVLKKHGYLK